MLTAQELLQTDFKQTFRGYNKEEVDAFVTRIVKAYETLARQNAELEEKIEQLEVVLQQKEEEATQREKTLEQMQNDTIALQEKYEKEAVERRQAIEQEATNVMTEAQAEANRLIQSAQHAVQQLKQEEKMLCDNLRQLLDNGRSLLTEYESEKQAGSTDSSPSYGGAAVHDGDETDVSSIEDTIPFARPEIAASEETRPFSPDDHN